MIEIEPVSAWGSFERELPAAVAAELNRSTAVRAVFTGPGDQWRLETNSQIGILVGDGWELRIRPHLDVPRLLFLLAYSLDPKGWHRSVVRLAEERDVIDALANGFAWHAERALDRGLLRGY